MNVLVAVSALWLVLIELYFEQNILEAIIWSFLATILLDTVITMLANLHRDVFRPKTRGEQQ